MQDTEDIFDAVDPKDVDLEAAVLSDLKIARGACLEVIANGRKLNRTLVQEMEDNDYTKMEEYILITKNILDSVKVLEDIHSNQPKSLQSIQKLKPKKKKINLDELMDD